MALAAGGGAGPRARRAQPAARTNTALQGNTDSQIDRRIVNEDRAIDPVTTGYHTTTPGATRTTPNPPGGGGGGGGDGTAPTAAQRAAAANLAKISGANAQSIRDEYMRLMAMYDQADESSRTSAKAQGTQNSKKSAGERFAQNKKLQFATQGLMGAAGNAMQGSSRGLVGDMLRSRTDMDTVEVLDTLRGNQDAVSNALYEALNANVFSRNEAASKAQTSLSNLESDMAAQLNNINPSLFVKPGTGTAKLGAAGFAKARRTNIQPTPAGGYIRPGGQRYPG